MRLGASFIMLGRSWGPVKRGSFMDKRAAGVLGGLAAGLLMDLAMVAGRRTGTLHETLDEKSEDWLDRTASARALVGDDGTTALEQANHFVASAAFGYAYDMLRERLPGVSPGLLGALYGGGLYVVNIAGIAPVLGITEGEQNVSGRVRGERLGLHILYGFVTAVVAEALSRRPATG